MGLGSLYFAISFVGAVSSSWRNSSRYRLRMLSSLVVALLICVGAVHWWPAPDPPDQVFTDVGPDNIQLEEIQPTDHDVRRQPPPPAPLPPEVVPEDVILEEEIDWSDVALDFTDPGDDAEHREGLFEEATAGQEPGTPARLLRAPQPNYTEAARDAELRARVEVLVTVNTDGHVETADIRGQWRIDANGTEHKTDTLGYGLDDAALAAAHRAQFRPATDDGEAVPTETTLSFRFGPRE